MDLYTDCQSLWGIKQGHRMPIESNLQPDIVQLRMAKEEGRIRHNIWVPTIDMSADALTKAMAATALLQAMHGVWKTTGEYAIAPEIHMAIAMYGVIVYD